MPVFKGSRYDRSNIISIENEEGITKLDVDKGKEYSIEDLEDDDYIIHKVGPGETLESIVYKYTGNSSYYYIIAQINDIYDPFESIEGKDLIIPSENFFNNI